MDFEWLEETAIPITYFYGIFLKIKPKDTLTILSRDVTIVSRDVTINLQGVSANSSVAIKYFIKIQMLAYVIKIQTTKKCYTFS